MAEDPWDCSVTNKAGSENDDLGNIECAVCLQPSVHPAKLPCCHVFCYLCIKGIVNRGRRCAMCRQHIPIEYLEKPMLLKPSDVENSSRAFEDGRSWFYKGRYGWWQYDERSSQELESAYQKGDKKCELLIAGFLYTADFVAMLQYRKDEPSKKRKIKRDLATTSSVGVAGLKTSQTSSALIPLNASNVVSSTLIQDLQNLHI